MKVLVLGGTGAMGSHLAKKLSQNGVNTYVTSRNQKLSQENLQYLQGNAKDLLFLKSILTQYWDVIIDFMVYSTNEFQNRLDILLNSTSQYIYISSGRVYAKTTQPIQENSERLLEALNDKDYLETDEYAIAKARQEDLLKKNHRQNWTIIRPYITYSQNRLQLGVLEKEEWLYRALHGRTIVFSKDIATRQTTLTYGLDVSNGIIKLIGNNNALGNTFHITSNEVYTWSEILKIYLDIIEIELGFKPKVLFQDLDSFIDLHPRKYQIKYDRLYNRQFDNSKISQFIDISNFTKTREGLSECLKEFIKHIEFKSINWEKEALKDNLTREKTSLKEIPSLQNKIKYIAYRYLPPLLIKILKGLRS